MELFLIPTGFGLNSTEQLLQNAALADAGTITTAMPMCWCRQVTSHWPQPWKCTSGIRDRNAFVGFLSPRSPSSPDGCLPRFCRGVDSASLPQQEDCESDGLKVRIGFHKPGFLCRERGGLFILQGVRVSPSGEVESPRG